MKPLLFAFLTSLAAPAFAGMCVVVPHAGGYGLIYTVIPVKALKLGDRTYEQVLLTESNGVSAVGEISNWDDVEDAKVAEKDAIAHVICQKNQVVDLPKCTTQPVPGGGGHVGMYGKQVVTGVSTAQQADAWRSEMQRHLICL